MKAKVLISYYSDGSGHSVHRIYFEKDYAQADKDLALVSIDECQKWELSECELFNDKKVLYPSVKERNDKLDFLINDEFEENESGDLKREFRLGFRNCWIWLREKGVI